MKHGGVASRATPSRSVTPDSTAPSHLAQRLNRAGQAEPYTAGLRRRRRGKPHHITGGFGESLSGKIKCEDRQ